MRMTSRREPSMFIRGRLSRSWARKNGFFMSKKEIAVSFFFIILAYCYGMDHSNHSYYYLLRFQIWSTSAMLLTKQELLLKASFADEWLGMRHFLTTVPKPACVIAHNGLGFDFRILCAEFDRNNIPADQRLPDGVFFIDSYLMAQDIETTYQDDLKKLVNAFDWSLGLRFLFLQCIPNFQSVGINAIPDNIDSNSSLLSYNNCW